jgi:PAS domain S-box-containing protein
MNPPVNKVILFESGAVLFLTIGIFVLDVLAPRGWAIWLLYLLPLALSLQSPRERDPYYFAAIVMPLTIAGGYLSPPGGIDVAADTLNRSMGIIVMWTFTWLMVRQKKARVQLAGAETARSQAETHREAAVAARELAEASAVGAIHRESQTARELLRSNLRLESILQSAMDAIVTVDEDQKVVLFNQAAERMFQCPITEAIGHTLDRFIPARYRGTHHRHVQSFGRSGVTNRKMGELGTVLGLRADGEEFPVEAAISHNTVDGKRFFTVILRDITERKQAERLLRQSEERYRRLISVSPLAVIVNRGNRVIFINDAGLRLFGAVKAEEILGKSPVDLFHPESRALVRERIHQLMEGNTIVPVVEEKIVTLDGTLVDVEVNAARFADEEGPAIVAMIRDVSDRKRLQEQLRKTERIAELGTLASGMAHEIGTPMNVILGRAEYLMDRVKDEPVKRGLQTIVVQVERITRVMNQLLAFARRKAPDRGPLALKAIIENSVEMFQERLARSRVLVEVIAEEPCPNVLADSDQMSQVMINLIMNAVHAMPDGGTLRIGLAQEKDMVKLTVADTGHGIPQEALKKIFEPFFTTKEFGKGTGLGLTVVKGIIEEHQGSIAVESAPGGGTMFTILLPMAPSA